MSSPIGDGPARGVIVHLNQERSEGQIKINRVDHENDVIPFLYSDVQIDSRYLSDLLVGLIVSLTVRTEKIHHDDKIILYRHATNVVLADDMVFHGVVSHIDYNEEKGMIHVDGLSTPIGFRLTHMPVDTEFSLVHVGDSVRVEIGFWSFVSIRKPPQPNAVTLVGEAAKRQNNSKRNNVSQTSNGEGELSHIPRRPVLRRTTSNGSLETRADDSDVSEPRSRARSLDHLLTRRSHKGNGGSSVIPPLHDVCCHPSVGPHVSVYPGPPCMMAQHSCSAGSFADARALQGWSAMRAHCQVSGFHHTSHHLGGSSGPYHPNFNFQQFLSPPPPNIYQGNTSTCRSDPNLLSEANEPETLRVAEARGADDTIIEMTVNELRDVVRRARARQI